MSIKVAMRMAMWTELRDAIRKDYPTLDVGITAKPNIEKFVINNADYIDILNRETYILPPQPPKPFSCGA